MGKSKLLTNSSMSCAKTCLRMYWLRYVKGLYKQKDETALFVGGMFHKGLELKEVPEFQDPPSFIEEPEEIYQYNCMQALSRGMVKAYLEYWKDDAVRTIETELEFKQAIINPETNGVTPNFKVAGKIDKIVQLPMRDNALALMEHKTTTWDIEPGQPYWRKLLMDQQISLYYMAAQAAGYDVRYILYDVTRRPQLQPKQLAVLDKDGKKIVMDEKGDRVYNKDGKTPRQTGGEGLTIETEPETVAAFEKRVYSDMMERPEYYFCRKDVPRLAGDLKEFEFELWQQQKMLQECYKNGYFFKNTDACFKWNKPCPYFDICTEGGIDESSEFAPVGFEFKKPHVELSEKGGN